MSATVSPINTVSLLERGAIGLLYRGDATRYPFEGLHKCASVCDLIVVDERDGSVVLLSERDDNTGTSITNYFEKLATQIHKTFLAHVDPEQIRWIEHYPKRVTKTGVPIADESFDRVTLKWNREHSCYTDIAWSRLSLQGVVIP